MLPFLNISLSLEQKVLGDTFYVETHLDVVQHF